MKQDLFDGYRYFARWLLISTLCGIVIGLVGGAFGQSITFLTKFRNAHNEMIYFLPVAGLMIAFLYHFDHDHTGTNIILEGIQEGKKVPFLMAPLIIVSTILTHAFGGSAGREGAALQLGAGISAQIGRLLKANDKDMKIFLMAGMSAGFSALFGTPLTATVFAMEVATVGSMNYSALFPCAVAALSAKATASFLGAQAETFEVLSGISLDIRNIAGIVFLAALCGLLSILFCEMLHRTEHLAGKISSPYLRIFAGGCLIVLLSKLLNTTDYLGAGMNIIEEAVEGKVFFAAFLLKMVFTSITLGTGYKGGEIVPSLFIGATFGCLFGQIAGIPCSLCAVCGMTALFCSVTNCPIASLLLSFEMFGFDYMPFFLITVCVSYLLSGYGGLYHAQKHLFSKTEFTNYSDRS